MLKVLERLPGGHTLFEHQSWRELRLASKLLDLAYLGETFFSRLQGIEFDNPKRNGEYLLIRRLHSQMKFVVDAGANRGDWSAQVLAEAGRDVRIACIEADPRNVRILQERFPAHPNIEIHQVAISNTPGPHIFSPGVDAGSGNGHLGDAAGEKAFEVSGLTLDLLSEQYQETAFDVVKCDLEGEDLTALLGAQKLFRSFRIGTLQLEYNTTWLRTGHRLRDVFEFAMDHKYTLLVATPFGFSQYVRYGEGLEDYRTRNLILAREDHLSLLKPLGPTGRARVGRRSAVH